MTYKTPANAPQSAVAASQAASKRIRPPAGMDKPARRHFDQLVKEFSAVEISPHKLSLVSMLARVMAQWDREERALEAEGPITTSQRGNPVMNPRARYVDLLAQQALKLRRTLGIHSAARGDQRDLLRRREINKQHEGTPRLTLIKRLDDAKH